MSKIHSRALARAVAPASEPISLAEAKLYLRVDANTEDAFINDLIVAARMSAENWLKRSLINQSWKIVYNDFAEEIVPLNMPPVRSVESVTVTSRTGGQSIVPASNYYLNAAKNKLVFEIIPTGFEIEILYNTGYGSAADIPQPIKYGMLAHIASMYDERGFSSQGILPQQAIALYAPFREVCL